MPSAATDAGNRARFTAGYEALRAAAGLPLGAPVGVALSGGPDSVALLLLAATSAIGPVAAMTVDHGLRAEASDEAAAAGAVAAMLGVPHRIARVTVPPAGEGLQGEARRARYAALAEWAEAEGLAAVLTAHHADDQAETVLMRLARGAGASGLAGIRPARPLGDRGVWLLRPLLGWRKTELEVIVAAAGIVPARDPSNHASRFDRTAARALLAQTPWLDPQRVAASASHLRDVEAALDDTTRRFVAQTVRVTARGVAFTPGDAPREIVRRALILLFSEHFGASPDGPGLARLMAVLAEGGTATLADVLGKGGEIWLFRPAPARRQAPQSL